MQGEWVYRPVITNYEALIFYNSMRRHPDTYFYNPVAIAKRDELGMKYRYLCIATSKTNPEAQCLIADIEIYKPPAGKPYVTNLYRIPCNKMFPDRFY